MRQIVLDTETTGLEWKAGHRVIEIAGVEMVDRRLTGNHFHHYLNPDREIDAGAQEVHGISLEFLQDKPRFADIVDEFLDYVSGAELVIHNAPFDVGFLNHELGLLGREPIEKTCSGVVDTLKQAKELHPGKRNSLDVLCERYAVDNSGRTLHGALLDSELLAEVYLAMTRGQESLAIDMGHEAAAALAFESGILDTWSIRCSVRSPTSRQSLASLNPTSPGGMITVSAFCAMAPKLACCPPLCESTPSSDLDLAGGDVPALRRRRDQHGPRHGAGLAIAVPRARDGGRSAGHLECAAERQIAVEVGHCRRHPPPASATSRHRALRRPASQYRYRRPGPSRNAPRARSRCCRG